MFNLKSYIRIVFFSLMSLPLIILIYFSINFSQHSSCISLYVKNKSSITIKNIAWPKKGLLTIWFDSAFFIKNSKTIMALMNKYQFSGVISLSKSNRCRPQSLSGNQLSMLQNRGWEITETNALHAVNGQHEINDMPAPMAENLAVYDMSSNRDDATLSTFLKKTNVRNGWIILYFHTNASSQPDKLISVAKLNHILRMIKRSGVPVVLQEQVLKVSQ